MQIFYKARVEENDSGKGDRRIKVRVMGIHPFEGEDDFEQFPDECLPWARMAPPVTGSYSGEVFNVPMKKEWVWVFFEDEGFQQPVYFAFVTSDTDKDINTKFEPNKNTVRTGRYNGDETVVTDDYNSMVTNGNGIFLSTKEHKMIQTNNKVATLLVDNKMKSYVGCDIDQSEQSMVYGNLLLDNLQSLLKTLKESFAKFKDETKDTEDGNYVEDSFGANSAIKSAIGSIEKISDSINNLQDIISGGITETIQAQNEGLGLTPENEGYINPESLPSLNLDDLSSINATDILDIEEQILTVLSNSIPSNSVVGGSVWMGEISYTAKINLVFLSFYKAIVNLYNMILYLKNRDEAKNAEQWKEFTTEDEKKYNGNEGRYDGIVAVHNNLKYTLNNNALFYPEAQDLNQLIVDELKAGSTPIPMDKIINPSFSAIRCREMKAENIRYIIIHCSDSSFGNAAKINEWHQQNGWYKIGYHYVILNGYPNSSKDQYNVLDDGKIETGRMENECGAHTVGFNGNSIGICLIGGTKDKWLTNNQMAALQLKVRELQKKYKIPNENVLGHCETQWSHGKTCPNFNNSAWVTGKPLNMEIFRKSL